MSEEVMLVAFILTLLGMLMSGYPVAFTLGGVALLFGVIYELQTVTTVSEAMQIRELSLLSALPMRIWRIITQYVLMAVPLFVFMGVMLEKSGLAEELLETMALLFGRMRGGLAISVVMVGALLAASTGIVGATVVTMGMLSLPTMLKRGYSAELSTGVIAASGTLGQIIPPSIVLVLLGSVLNVPIGDMFLGAVFPGLILVALYVLWVVIIAIAKPDAAPAMPAEELADFKGMVMVKRVFSAFVPPTLLIIAVLGSIFVGIASPTEAAAVGAMGATILTIAQGKFNRKTLVSVMQQTTHLTCMVFMILVGATAFALVFRGLSGDEHLVTLITGANLGPKEFLLLVMIIVFIAGFFIDFIEITFIIVPVVAPIFMQMGVDLVWLGVLIAINLQTSFMTPPFGFSLFYLKGVAPPEIETRQIYRGIIPFIIIQLIALGIVYAFPETVLWLPAAMVD
jgi:tripartite ATP-independent transporter DctM subunit